MLQQIKVRHPYYYREMFIPQVTSGPSARRLVARRARADLLDAGLALAPARRKRTRRRQLTDGPGYDYQPDWSPDGRRVVYASYRDDAIELRLLDLATGESAPLVANGAVQLEPRWSPDGRRLAFTSTLYEGRWHVFVAAVDGATGRAERSSGSREDHDSGLPRYYYNTVRPVLLADLVAGRPGADPDLQPGPHLGLRRILADGGARRAARRAEIRDEETTWKARPDWSRDGRRVVYSSYLGRQWNQLWLMTADGGEPAPAHLRRRSTPRRPAGRPTGGRSPTSRTRAETRRSGSSMCRAGARTRDPRRAARLPLGRSARLRIAV